MFKFKFGLFWTLFTMVLSGIMITAFMNTITEALVPLILFLLFFLSIGIFIMFLGRKEIKRDKQTEEFGEITYGRISNFVPTGAYVNGTPELAVEIIAYVPETGTTQTFKETIGFGTPKYSMGGFLRLKYYNGDVNIDASVDEREVPTIALEEIGKVFVVGAEDGVIEISGEKYVKML